MDKFALLKDKIPSASGRCSALRLPDPWPGALSLYPGGGLRPKHPL